MKQTNNYVLNFTNHKNLITKIFNSTSHNGNLKLIIITSVFMYAKKEYLDIKQFNIVRLFCFSNYCSKNVIYFLVLSHAVLRKVLEGSV